MRPEPRVAYARLVREMTARRDADEAAIRAARERLPEAVRILVERHGARRVVLFGSLATGLFHHARSDIDLAVEGLDFDRLWRAEEQLRVLFGRKTDLVPMEAASDALRRELVRRGEVLHGA